MMLDDIGLEDYVVSSGPMYIDQIPIDGDYDDATRWMVYAVCGCGMVYELVPDEDEFRFYHDAVGLVTTWSFISLERWTQVVREHDDCPWAE